MASLGSDVQSTSIELVSIIEEMKERKKNLDAEIKHEEMEKLRILDEMKSLEARLHLVDKDLDEKLRARDDLDRTISETFTAFKGIVEASRKLLSTAKEESSQLQNRGRALK